MQVDIGVTHQEDTNRLNIWYYLHQVEMQQDFGDLTQYQGNELCIS